MKKMKQIAALILVCSVLVAMFPASAIGRRTYAPAGAGGVMEFSGDFTYTVGTGRISGNWNPHTYAEASEAYPLDYLTAGLYTFVFNDALHPVAGTPAYKGYAIVPEMAASLPVDVTQAVKEEGKFFIPDDAESGYAYTIDLNPDAAFEDGTAITADDYVESMKRLLDPRLQNYRADGYYSSGLISLVGAEAYANAGQENTVTLSALLDKYGCADLDELLAEYGSLPAYINWQYSLGEAYDFATGEWGPAEDMIVYSGATIAQLVPLYIEKCSEWADEETVAGWVLEEIYGLWSYPADVGFDTVGLYKSGEYQITLVLNKEISEFNLLYALTGNWLVNTELYDECLQETAEGWSSTYGTDVQSTCSYGPYCLSEYEGGERMHFVKNENWYGYSDGKHVYVDPVDGLTYPMYQTTEIEYKNVPESELKERFMSGELMEYVLTDNEEFRIYRNSEYCYFSPGVATYFLLINGQMDTIRKREADASFDTDAFDLQTLTLNAFHRAMGLSFDRGNFCAACNPAYSPALGLIGDAYIYDSATGARYRDTDAAKRALCEVYGVDASEFFSLDEAVASITGYDPNAARIWYQAAFEEALALGYITDSDEDGICDQTIRMTYASGDNTEKLYSICNYFNEKLDEVTDGTGFAGKIEVVMPETAFDNWYGSIRDGWADLVLAGWTGAVMNPFGLISQYADPNYSYDANWFNAAEHDLTLTVNGESITMSLLDWSRALNGFYVEVDGETVNFGEASADADTRIAILAALEKEILLQYNHLPFTQGGSMALLSQKLYYAVEEYNSILQRGGLAYLRYNYTDSEWADYVEFCGGVLEYRDASMIPPELTASLNSSEKPYLAWTSVSGAQKYEIWVAENEEGEYTLLWSGRGRSLAHSEAQGGKTYYYKVRAMVDGIYGDFGDVQSVTVPVALSAPTVTIKLNGDNKPVISWTSVAGAEKYELYRATSKNGAYTKLANLTTTTATNKNVVEGVTYYYKVRAVAGDAYSEYSTVVSVKVPEKIVLTAPTVTVTNNAATGKNVISWTAVAGAEKYEIWGCTTKNGSYSKLGTVTGTSATHSKAAAGKTYYYKVRAIAGDMTGPVSAAVGKTCDLARPVVTASINASSGKIVLTWAAISGADKYEIYRCATKDGTYSKLGTVTGTTATISSAKPGETWYFRVKAIYSANSGANSAASVAVGKTCDCARPTLTVKLNAKGKPVLSWNAVEGAVKYEIYASTTKDGTYTKLGTVTGTSVNHSSAKSGVTYYYKVKAICSVSSGDSAFSAIKSVTAK